MKRMSLTCLGLMFVLLLGPLATMLQAANYTIDGVIRDAAGLPVEGAEVNFYLTKSVKKPADFTSSRTGSDGKYTLVVPEGQYYAIAVYRKSGAKFGPLQAGDKHSGEAVLVTIDDQGQHHFDFTVMNLREAARQAQKRNEAALRVSGKIVDGQGEAVAMAYAFADKVKQTKQAPHYMSAWTDDSGTFTLYLPKGVFYLGAQTSFPVEAGYNLEVEVDVEENIEGLKITLGN